MKVSVKSNGKINIGLNIIEKLPNGYHSLDMTMVPISLADDIEINFTVKKGKLSISSNKKDIPTDERNILWKVYNAFYKFLNRESDETEIYLHKVIPHEAGLGGGSSNGAFFLKELNKYNGNILSDEELIAIGKTVGADIPFFIKNYPCRVKGIGENLEKIENNLNCDIVLVKPDFGVSTKEAYNLYSTLKNKKNADIDNIIDGLKENNLEKVEKNSENILEQGLLTENENIKNFRKELNEKCSNRFFMSGSGSCYYTFCPKGKGNEYAEALKTKISNCQIYSCSFL